LGFPRGEDVIRQEKGKGQRVGEGALVNGVRGRGENARERGGQKQSKERRLGRGGLVCRRLDRWPRAELDVETLLWGGREPDVGGGGEKGVLVEEKRKKERKTPFVYWLQKKKGFKISVGGGLKRKKEANVPKKREG